MTDGKQQPILLGLMPFWTPLIPPLGIAMLRSFLEQEGYPVKTVDFNIDEKFKALYYRYFRLLEQWIPINKRGNFYNMGHDVMQAQMTAHLYKRAENPYTRLVKLVVEKNYGCVIREDQAEQLTGVVEAVYSLLAERILDLVRKEAPAVLGLSVFRGTLPTSLFAFQQVRREYPHIKTVMGGGIFSQELDTRSPDFAGFLEKTPYIDAFIVGEGETLFLKWLQGELQPEQKVYTPVDIRGENLDLDTAPAPDISGFDLKYYPYLPAYASRSCPFQCSFCAETIYWGKFRKMGVAQVVRQLETLHQVHRHQLFLMCDSLLNPVITPLAEELRRRQLPVYWDGYLRADREVCDKANTILWRNGGFYRARLGIESGAPHVLELMGKKITPLQIKTAVSNLAEAGIKTTTYWVIGHPGETEEDFRQTLDLIEVLKDDIYEAECNPFRYFLTGQVDSDTWHRDRSPLSLYGDTREVQEMVLLPTRVLSGEPSREETLDRMIRFTDLCRRLGIPNPYTLEEIKHADERWKKLHPNAVPALLEFNIDKKNGTLVRENRRIKEVLTNENIFREEGDFSFQEI